MFSNDIPSFNPRSRAGSDCQQSILLQDKCLNKRISELIVF
jgi:hypothetical protein